MKAFYLTVGAAFLLIAAGCQPSGAVAEGKAVYTRLCAACHGAKGEGQPNWTKQRSDDTLPAPPHDKSGHTWHHGDGTLYRIVMEGGQIFEQPGFKSSMPAFTGQMSPEQTRAVIDYIRTFWGAKERQQQAEMSAKDPFPAQ